MERNSYDIFGNFASAHPMRVASDDDCYRDVAPDLCLSASHAGCIGFDPFDDDDKDNFASAHPMRVASDDVRLVSAGHGTFASAHPMRVASYIDRVDTLHPRLCLSASHAGCIS